MPLLSRGRHQFRVIVLTAAGLCAYVPTLSAVEVDDAVLAAMQRELQALKNRVAELERRLGERPADTHVAAPPAPAPPPPPAAPQITLGGQIKLNVIANTASVGGAGGSNSGDFALSPGAIPLSDRDESNQLSFSAHATRLWLQARQPTPLGEAAAFAEMDFFSSNAGDERVSNSYTPRLRHAYGEWRGWTAGHTHSTFMNASAFPELNDDGIPAGVVSVRQPLIRKRFGDGSAYLDVAAESPESTITAIDGTRIAADDDRQPDWIVRLGRSGAFGNVSLSAMARELRLDGTRTTGVDDAAIGYALSVSGRLRIGAVDDVRFGLTGGNAVGRYMSANAFNAARIRDGDTLVAVDSAGGFLALRHWWGERWRSNVALGAAWQESARAHPTENEWLATSHVNLLFSPWAATTLGVEWIHAWRSRFDGRSAHLDRLQLTALHKF